VQQVAAVELGGLAQVEVQRFGQSFGLEAEGFLLLGQVLLQGRGGQAGGYFAQLLPNHQLLLHQGQGLGVAAAQDGHGRFL